MSRALPSTATAIKTLAAVAWRRITRGKALWVCVLIAALPMFLAPGVRAKKELFDVAIGIEYAVMMLLPAVFVASSIGEEIEGKTTTYLWSRPIARWTMVIGKLIALAPVSAALVVIGWLLAVQIGTNTPPSAQSIAALTAGALASSMVAAGIASLVPSRGMALSIIYLVIIDMTIGAIPASLRVISISYQVRLLSGLHAETEIAAPAIRLAIIAGVWLVLGVARIRTREA